MKSVFIMSERVAGFLKHGRNYTQENLDKVVQMSEAVLNDRQLLNSEELGMKNKVKDDTAESSILAKYRSQRSVVTAWIEYSQAKSGRVDRLATKAEKLGVVCTVADIPSTFAGQAIGEWVAQFGPSAEAKPQGEAEAQPQANPKPQGNRKGNRKGKRGTKPKLPAQAEGLEGEGFPAEPVTAGASNGEH